MTQDPKTRLLKALVAYAVLIALAFAILDGLALKAVLILFGGLLAKTLVAWKIQQVVPDRDAGSEMVHDSGTGSGTDGDGKDVTSPESIH